MVDTIDLISGGSVGSARLPTECVVGQRVVDHRLDRIEAGTVVHVDKGQALLGIAPGADPALDGNGAINRNLVIQCIANARVSHGNLTLRV